MKENMKKESLEWLKAIAVGVIIFVIIRTFFFSNYVVEGESMLPTLEEGDKLIVNKMGYRVGEMKRFDVIVFHASKQEDYVKRIIGVPGDRIEFRDDKLFINGKLFKESYLGDVEMRIPGSKLTGDFTLDEITGEETVPEGMLFVLGDNRLGSWDSRHFGFVSMEQVVGKVNVRYWPIQDFGVSF